MAQVQLSSVRYKVAIGRCGTATCTHGLPLMGLWHTCPRGSANAGKTTLLEVLAGKHMVGRDAVRILGRPAFYDLMLVTSGELGYLGNQWRRSVACAGSSLTLQVLLR